MQVVRRICPVTSRSAYGIPFDVWNGGIHVLLTGLLWLAVPSAARADILVVAPHPDDDIIMASGVVQRALARNEPVWVVYVTNGDFAGVSTGTLRQGEAVAAQAALGLDEDRLIFLGYP